MNKPQYASVRSSNKLCVFHIIIIYHIKLTFLTETLPLWCADEFFGFQQSFGV